MKLDVKKAKGKRISLNGYKCRITNDSKEFEKIIVNPEINERIGYFSSHEFLDNATYVYIDGKLDDISSFKEMDKIGLGFTYYLLREIQYLTHYFWAVKDNNVYVRDGFLIAYPNDFADAASYKASLSVINSNSTNSFNFLSNFSDTEIDNALDLMNNKLFHFDSKDEDIYDGDFMQFKYPRPDVFRKSKESTRYKRAFMFVLMARSYHLGPMKIVSYVNALECLFTTNKSELNYRMSERIAFLIEDSPNKRKELFDTVKDAYNLRSTIVHGEHIKIKDTDLTELSEKLDSIIRVILVQYKDIFENKSDNQLNEMFDDLIFNQ